MRVGTAEKWKFAITKYDRGRDLITDRLFRHMARVHRAAPTAPCIILTLWSLNLYL